VGKTTMGKSTALAMKKYHCIHATPLGVTPNLFIDQIHVKDVFWFEELGSIEAAWQLELRDLGPFLVDMNCEGRNPFDELDAIIEDKRKKAYERLNIPEDFEYTKLYWQSAVFLKLHAACQVGRKTSKAVTQKR
jgi:hypothetical protein